MSRGVGLKRTLLGSLLAGLSSWAWAAPQGGSVQAGSVQIQAVPGGLNLQQLSDRAIINWNSFNIDANEIVRILQPGAAAVLLNRVVGQDPSVILGQLQANGQVWLVNPNGVLFGPGAQVDVAGLLATTLKVSDADFLAGRGEFSQDPSHPLAAVINQGAIRVADGGHLVLLAPLVSNEGVLVAHLGQVVVGAGESASISFDAGGLISYQLKSPVGPAGPVVLSPEMVSDVLRQVVQQKGVGEAGALTQRPDGLWELSAGSGTALQAGRIDAAAGRAVVDSVGHTVATSDSVSDVSSANGKGGDLRLLSQGSLWAQTGSTLLARGATEGGFVEVSAPRLSMAPVVDTRADSGKDGTFLIDPTDIRIVDGSGGSGGGQVQQGDAPIDGDGITTTLGKAYLQGLTTNISLEATRDIIITGSNALSLGGSRSLTLHAVTGDIITNPTIPGSSALSTTSGSITLMAGGDITMGSMSTSAGGAIYVTAGGSINTLQPSSISGSGGVSLIAGATGDVVLASQTSIQGTNFGSAGIQAGRDVILNTNSSLSSNNAVVTVTAGRNIEILGQNTLTAGGAVVLTANQNLTAGPLTTMRANSAVALEATNGDVALAPSVTLGNPSNIAGQLQIIAGGSIRATADPGAAAADALTGTSVLMQAGGNLALPHGIRSTGALTLQAGLNSAAAFRDLTLVQTVSSTGAMTLEAGGNAAVSTLTATNGPLSVTAGGSISNQAGTSIISGGAITLTAGASGDINLGANTGVLGTGAGNTVLDAGRDIIVAASSTVSSDLNNLTVSAGRNLQTLGNNVLTADSGAVSLTAGQSMTLGVANLVRGGPTSSVMLAATNGDVLLAPNVVVGNPSGLGGQLATLQITAGGSVRSTADAVASTDDAITGRTVQISAGGEINLPHGIQANQTITLQAGQNAAAPARGLTLVRTVSAPGLVTLNAGGDVSVGSITSTTGGVTVNAGGSFANAASSSISSGGAISLNAGAAGDITLASSSGVQTTGLGDTVLNAGRDVVLAAGSTVASDNNNLSVTAGRDLIAQGNNPLTAYSGSVTLTAGRDLTLGAAGIVRSASAGQITLNATAGDMRLAPDISVGNPTAGAAGALTMTAGGSIGPTLDPVSPNQAAFNGTNVLVTAGSDVVLTQGVRASGTLDMRAGLNGAGSLTTDAVRAGTNLTLQARDNVTTAAVATAQGGSMTVTATTGDIDMVVASSAAGPIEMVAGRDLILEGTLSTNADMELRASRNFENQTLSAVGDVVVAAGGTLTLHNSVASSGGAIRLQGGSIGENVAGQGTLTAGVINMVASSGNIALAGNVGSGDLAVSAFGDVTLNSVTATQLAANARGTLSVRTADSVPLTVTGLPISTTLPNGNGVSSFLGGVRAANVVLNSGGDLTLGGSSLLPGNLPGVVAEQSASLTSRTGNIVGFQSSAAGSTAVDVNSPTTTYSANGGAGSVGSVGTPVRVNELQSRSVDTLPGNTFFQIVAAPPPPPPPVEPPPVDPPVVVPPVVTPVQPPVETPSVPTPVVTPPAAVQQVGGGLGFLPGNLAPENGGNGSSNQSTGGGEKESDIEVEGGGKGASAVAQALGPQGVQEPRLDAPLQSPVLLSFELDQLMSLPLTSPYLDQTVETLMDQPVTSPFLEQPLDQLMAESVDAEEPAPAGGPRQVPQALPMLPGPDVAMARLDAPMQSPVLLSFGLNQLMSMPLTSPYLEQTVETLLTEPVQSPYLELTLDRLLRQPVDAAGPNPK